MATLAERPDPAHLPRVRIIPPSNPRSIAFPSDYDLEIEGTRVNASSFDVRFEHKQPPIITVTFAADIDRAEFLAAIRLTTGNATDEDEPPFPGCLEEC